MPILIVGFALGAYAFGSALRGSSIIVNEVGIVRGAPDATEGRPRCTSASSRRRAARTRSPSRAARSCRRRSRATCSAGPAASLDVIQGDPSRVRDLSVGFGSLRTIRAESQAVVPKIHAELPSSTAR